MAAISSTGDPNSFGYSTARERWPIILQNVIEDIEETVAGCDTEMMTEGRQIILDIEYLRNDIINDNVLE
jgi:damage-control phosphatase, subfamily III